MEGFPGANTPETKEDRISREDFEKILKKVGAMSEKAQDLLLSYAREEMSKEDIQSYLDKGWLEGNETSREDFEKIFSEIESLREKDKSLALEYIKGDMDKESVEYYLDKKWLE